MRVPRSVLCRGAAVGATAVCVAFVPTLWLTGCRIERVQDVQGGSVPEKSAPARVAEPLAWSRDVAVLAAVEPAMQSDATLRAVRQLSRELCERLTLQSDVDAAWHAAVVRLDRELSAHGYLASDVLLSSSDGRWGASVLTAASDDQMKRKAAQPPLMETAWHYWEHGSGLQPLPEPESSKPEPRAAESAQTPGEAAVVPPVQAAVIEDPSRNWVNVLPVGPETPPPVPIAPVTPELEPHSPDESAPPSRLADESKNEDEDDAGVAELTSQTVPAEPGRPQPDLTSVALLVRLSDGSFRGTWLRATTDPEKVDAVVRDAIVGERLYVGALGAVFALDVQGQPREPSAASRAYERLLQPGSGKAPATLVLTNATLESDHRPGVFALSSRGAEAGKCRLVFQESAL